nr:unnamed protein product [Callosobruchus analis]
MKRKRTGSTLYTNTCEMIIVFEKYKVQHVSSVNTYGFHNYVCSKDTVTNSMHVVKSGLEV